MNHLTRDRANLTFCLNFSKKSFNIIFTFKSTLTLFLLHEVFLNTIFYIFLVFLMRITAHLAHEFKSNSITYEASHRVIFSFSQTNKQQSHFQLKVL